MSMPNTTSPNPFVDVTDLPLVAIKGLRCGYLQLADSQPTPSYAHMSDSLLLAARDWARQLEVLGAPRVYWVTLSEVVTHLHIHLYPRWPEDILKGIPLFEARENVLQPPWTTEAEQALELWAEVHHVELFEQEKG